MKGLFNRKLVLYSSLLYIVAIFFLVLGVILLGADNIDDRFGGYVMICLGLFCGVMITGVIISIARSKLIIEDGIITASYGFSKKFTYKIEDIEDVFLKNNFATPYRNIEYSTVIVFFKDYKFVAIPNVLNAFEIVTYIKQFTTLKKLTNEDNQKLENTLDKNKKSKKISTIIMVSIIILMFALIMVILIATPLKNEMSTFTEKEWKIFYPFIFTELALVVSLIPLSFLTFSANKKFEFLKAFLIRNQCLITPLPNENVTSVFTSYDYTLRFTFSEFENSITCTIQLFDYGKSGFYHRIISRKSYASNEIVNKNDLYGMNLDITEYFKNEEKL